LWLGDALAPFESKQYIWYILDERRITRGALLLAGSITRPIQSGRRRCNPHLWLVEAHRVLIVAIEHAVA